MQAWPTFTRYLTVRSLLGKKFKKALDLDDQLAEAHNSRASLLYLIDRDWEGADREFKRALELDHNYAPAHHWYSMYLALKGRKEEALVEAREGIRFGSTLGGCGCQPGQDPRGSRAR